MTSREQDEKHSVEATKRPPLSLDSPLHIPEPLSMTRAAISSSSDMLRVVLLVAEVVACGKEANDFYEDLMTASKKDSIGTLRVSLCTRVYVALRASFIQS